MKLFGILSWKRVLSYINVCKEQNHHLSQVPFHMWTIHDLGSLCILLAHSGTECLEGSIQEKQTKSFLTLTLIDEGD